jgi:exodeoxyribonuclease V alpha subunit
MGYRIVICSPTAIAANKLFNKCNKVINALIDERDVRNLTHLDKFRTIHKLLNKYEIDEGKTAYIIDEASMLNLSLFSKFLKNVQYDDKIILIGDNDQLPPIVGSSILEFFLNK